MKKDSANLASRLRLGKLEPGQLNSWISLSGHSFLPPNSASWYFVYSRLSLNLFLYFFFLSPFPNSANMAPVKKSSGKDLYSVILPTFNERENLPIITWLLNRTFTQR